jgi:hypothetical protein
MRAVFRAATSNGLISPRLSRFRLDTNFDCLAYAPPHERWAISSFELCFDRSGRLVESIDRNTGSRHFASLQEQPSLAAIRVSVPSLLRALVAVGAFRDARLQGVSPKRLESLPVGYDDSGLYYHPAVKKPTTP